MPCAISLLLRFALILLTASAFAQQPYPPTTDHTPPAWFVDVASKAGITVRNVNGRRMQRRNSALMTKQSERGTKQIGTDFAIIRARRRVHQNFFTGPH